MVKSSVTLESTNFIYLSRIADVALSDNDVFLVFFLKSSMEALFTCEQPTPIWIKYKNDKINRKIFYFSQIVIDKLIYFIIPRF